VVAAKATTTLGALNATIVVTQAVVLAAVIEWCTGSRDRLITLAVIIVGDRFFDNTGWSGVEEFCIRVCSGLKLIVGVLLHIQGDSDKDLTKTRCYLE